jgi:hypothetical protein
MGMTYRIEPGGEFTKEIRRVVTEEAQAAVDVLRSTGSDDREVAVHEARKHCKKARAALRLAAPLFDDDELRACTRPIRDAGRALAPERDVAVVLSTLTSLREAHREQLRSEFVDQIQLELEQRRDAVNDGDGAADPAQVTRNIEEALMRLQTWRPVQLETTEALERGLVASYRKSARAYRRVEQVASVPEAWHRWRQAVKDVWYDSRLLRRAWPPVMRGVAKGLDRSAESLGEAQNLSLLIATIEGGRGTAWNPYGADLIIDLAERRRDALWSVGLSDGARIHAEKPVRFARRVARYWDRAVAEAKPEKPPSESPAA